MSQNNYFFVVLLTVLSLASADVAMSIELSDTNNKHNLSSAATHGGPHSDSVASGGTDQICIFCHTPHSATPESTLWSRPDPNTTFFPLYNSTLVIKGQLGAPAGAQERSQYKNDGSVIYPSGASRLCLSCHDGVTAIGILNDGTWIAMTEDYVTNDTTFPVISLSTSHPISFVYDNAVLADIESVRGATYQLPLNLTVFTPLDGENKMQCTTCHDPHEDTRADGTYGLLPFWRHQGGGASYGDVCDACHVGANPTFDGTDHTSPDLN